MKVNAEKFATDVQKRLTDLLIFSAAEKRQLYIAHGEVLLASVKRQFIGEGTRFLNHKWARLAESTIKANKSKGYTGKILDRTGRLKAATQISIGPNGPEITNNVKYAEYLQFGTRFMSPRPFLPMPPFLKSLLPDDIERIRNVTIKAFELKIRKLK